MHINEKRIVPDDIKKHKLYSSEFVFKGINSTFGWSSSGRKDHSYLLSQILS